MSPEKKSTETQHLIDMEFAARELRKLGESEMTYLAEAIKKMQS